MPQMKRRRRSHFAAAQVAPTIPDTATALVAT
jgi:hypothetical protein